MDTADFERARDVVRLTPGRTRLVVGRIGTLLNDEERTRIERFLNAAEMAAEEAVDLSRKRRLRRRAVYGRAAQQADNANDAALRAVSDTLAGAMRNFPDEGEPIGDAARRLDAALFPQGVNAIITTVFPRAVALTLSLLKESREPALAADVAAVPGLASWLGVLQDRATTFDAALKAEAAREVDPQMARDAARRCEQRLHELACAIQADLAGDDPAVVARRSELLAPHYLQVDELRRRYQRQLPLGDIDPESGELVDDEEGDADLGEQASAAAPPLSLSEDVTATDSPDSTDPEQG